MDVDGVVSVACKKVKLLSVDEYTKIISLI